MIVPSQNSSTSLLDILERPKKVYQTLTRVQAQIRIKYAKLLNIPPSEYSGIITSEQSHLNDDFKKRVENSSLFDLFSAFKGWNRRKFDMV